MTLQAPKKLSVGLIVHVGPGKTGTSAIQNALSENNDILKKNGFYYPMDGDRTLFAGNGAELARILNSTGNEAELYSEIVSIMYNYANEAIGCQTIILSNELFAGTTRERLMVFRAALDEIFERYSIVFFCRDPYWWLHSNWSQSIKRAGYAGSFEDYLASHEYDLAIIYRTYIDIFGREIVFIPYRSKGVVGLFFEKAGILAHVQLDVRETVVNRSLAVAELDMLRLVNSYFGNAELSAMISDRFITNSPSASAYRVLNIVLKKEIDLHYQKIMAEITEQTPGLTLQNEDEDPAGPGDPAGLGMAQAPEDYFVLLDAVLACIKNWMSLNSAMSLLRHVLDQNLTKFEGQLPPDFDPVHYLLINDDVLQAGSDPVEHFIRYGEKENREYLRKFFVES